jgi:hypothetical protein
VRKITLAAALVVAVAVLGESFGYVRALIGVAMFCGIAYFGFRYVGQLGQIPPEPEIADVSEYGLKYVCRNCGLQLRVEKAARDKAPTHCMEPMELLREGGRPPLRPV